MGLSVPANTEKASNEEVLRAIEKSSKAIIVTVKEIDNEAGLDSLDPKTKQELIQLMKDAKEIFDHVREAESHHQVKPELVRGSSRDEKEMESILQDLESKDSQYVMAMESKLKTLEKYTKELEKRV